MVERTSFAEAAFQITSTALLAVSCAAVPYFMYSVMRASYVGALTNDELDRREKQAISEMQAAPLDGQINDWYLKSRAYLNCKPPEIEYRDTDDGLRDATKVRAFVQSGKCKLYYGWAPPPACGYGACYAIASLVIGGISIFTT